MGVPDEVDSPVRKRPRLSLRGSRKLESKDNSEASEINVNKAVDSHTSLEPAKKIESTLESADLMADLPLSSSDPLVPPVASLHNLGNTCFLNSMLEVLRFTPGFLNGIKRLTQDIEVVEKIKENTVSDSVNVGTQLVWQIVKNAHHLFEEMESRERQYNQLATSDASSMAVGPSALLDIIRKLNPMFEGHFQHDAQELLRCLLCYVEDAEKDVQRARMQSEIKTPVEILNPFHCDRNVTDSGGTPQSKGDAQGEVALKGGDSRRKDQGKGMKKGRGRPWKAKSIAHGTRNLNEEPKNSAVCEVNNLSNPIPGPNPGLEIVSALGGDTNIDLSTSAPSNRQKRKRSRSESQGKSDQSCFSSTSNSSKVRNGSQNKMVKVDSLVPLRNGSIINFVRSTDNVNSEPMEHLAEFRAGGSPSLLEKVTLSHNSRCPVFQNVPISQTSIESILPLSDMKCSGVRGCTDTFPYTQSLTTGHHYSQDYSTETVEKSQINSNRSGDDNNNNYDDCETNNGENGWMKKSADHPIEIDSDDEKCKLPKSPVKKLQPVTASPTKLLVYSPSKLPRIIEVVDEISIDPECSSAFFESTIDSVTKKYFSSLSPARLQSSSLSKPALPDMGHFTSETLTFPNIELIVEEPMADVLNENQNASSESPNFTEEMHVTVHSPYKINDKDHAASPKNHTKRLLTPMHSPTSGSQTLTKAVPQSECALMNTETTQNKAVQLLKLLSGASNVTLPGLTDTQNDLPHMLKTKRLSFSAPSTPVCISFSYPRKNSDCLTGELQDKSLSCESPKELQLRLKKCDWLGVSPVKSVSAKKALSVLAHDCPTGADVTATGVRRKIFQNDNDGNFGKNVVPSSQQQNKDMVQSSLQQNNHVPVDVQLEPSEEKPYNCEENAGTSSRKRNSSAKQKKNELSNSLTVSLRPRKKNSQPDKKDDNRDSHSQEEPLKKDQCPTETVSFSKTSLLKTLSVSLDKCDWLLLPGARSGVSAKQAMLDMKKSVSVRMSRGGRQSSMQTSVSAAKLDDVTRSKTNTLVEHLFGGTMMHRTKCLECEIAKERQEVFMDISIPVKSLHAGDVDSDEEGAEKSEDSCLDKLMQAFSNIERLKDNNKYFCEECIHYVEAERSCHYTTLPLVLTLHLKRFGSVSGRFGGVSKLNDKVAIPQYLPCLQYNCKETCTDPTHSYSLFAIVTHSGMSVLHGHYRAYVKVQPAVSPEMFANLCKTIIKSEPVGDVQGVPHNSELNLSESDTMSHSPRCASMTANKLTKIEPKQEAKSEAMDGFSSDLFGETGSTEQLNVVSNNKDTQSPGANDRSSQAEWDCFWLECDDECIRVLEEVEFIEKLEEKDGALMGTPYILFYHKLVLM